MSVIVMVCIILLIVAKVDCTTKTAMPSIHSSRVVSTAEDLTSSCVVIEEGVPVCQDEDEDDTRYAYCKVTVKIVLWLCIFMIIIKYDSNIIVRHLRF